ncbi:transporter substrate-binding domain-containing protein [Bosea sp. BIWAKO-01]|uniref:transporter substrate-binding domain-containing protein n=1 Tax=Bosea sp. BIWAKO-01 TaxID=506668 RepID=UPI000852E6B4|nr:transporter substrate-binding domain-containing protein [Bosea sp. BIWAKO-01]GAU80238.1 extracellular solute-binding protein [Bosea sp. BIWAKO-01]
MNLAEVLAPGGKLRAAINLGNPVLAQRFPGSGELGGVSVALARELAGALAIDLELQPYDSAARVVEACQGGAWDIAFLAIDPQRARQIAFSDPYIVIEGVFVVKRDAPWQRPGELDRPGHRIAVGRGAAYDLHLGRMLRHAELVRVPTSAEALPHFLEAGLEAGAGIRQPSQAFVASHPGLRFIEEPFMEIRQAMAVSIARAHAMPALSQFLRRATELPAIKDALASLATS